MAISRMWLSPNPDGIQACEIWSPRCWLCCGTLESLADTLEYSHGLHSALLSPWNSTFHAGTKPRSPQWSLISRCVPSSSPGETEVSRSVHIKNLGDDICISVSSGWRYKGKVRKYIPSFMGNITLGWERGAYLTVFLSFWKVYSWDFYSLCLF